MTDMIKQEWVYTGRRMNVGNELVDAFLPLTAEGLCEDKYVHYPAKQTERVRSIGIYEVECTPDRTKARIANARWLREYEGSDLLLEWKAANDATMLALRARQMEKGAKNLHLESLRPLRALYQKSTAPNRAALEIIVLNYLRGL